MLSHQILLPPTGWAGDLGVLWGLKFGSHTSATSNKGHTVRPHAADNTSGSGEKTGKTFFFVFEIQDHHAVELTERSPNPPSDSSLSKHVAGDSTFSFYGRRRRGTSGRGPRAVAPAIADWSGGALARRRAKLLIARRAAQRGNSANRYTPGTPA